MKIFKLSSFEKLNINPIKLNILNNLDNNLSFIIYPNEKDYFIIRDIYCKLKKISQIQFSELIDSLMKLYNTTSTHDIFEQSIKHSMYLIDYAVNWTNVLFIFDSTIIENYLNKLTNIYTKIWTSKYNTEKLIEYLIKNDVKFKNLKHMENENIIEPFIYEIL